MSAKQSSGRCKSKARYEKPTVKRTTIFRCNRKVHPDDNHQARHGDVTLRWSRDA